MPSISTKSVIALLLVLSALLSWRKVLADDANRFSPPPFKVPDGFTIEVVAASPLVKYPMMGCFDERGRLFVAESLGQNLNKEQLLEQRCRFIRMLEDTDQDGKFDKSTIFADKLVMPEGALWHRGSLYVLSSPYLWRFEDTDDDGVADVREKLVGYMDFTGQANQHGAYLGPNGRLYFSGGHLGYDLKGKEGVQVAKGRAAAVFSCWPDGSDVQVFGNGGINPVEVAFTAEGELLTTCPIFDSIGGRHDALIHWVRGATAGPKDYAPPVLKQSGYRIPAVRRWGQVAPSGLTRYRSAAFGKDFENSFFATHFNTATVVNTKLQRVGSTFEGTDRDFITSTNRDFHPTDVIEDGDGSLLMIDTGGWFLISCPLSKVAKPEITGAIYRVRRMDSQGPADPRGLEIDWRKPSEQLLRHLDDVRPVVRDRAIEALAAIGDEAVEAMKAAWDSLSEQARRNAVWSLSRIDSETSRGQLRTALGDVDDSVVQAATRSVGVSQDGLGVTSLWEVLKSDSMPKRCAAASALGAIGDTSSVPHLLQALTLPGDDHLRHALVYALIEIADADATAAGLTHADPRVQHAALVALDQMKDAPLSREQVAPLLASSDDLLKRTAIEIVTDREGWSDEIVQLLEGWSRGENTSQLNDELVVAMISTFHADERVQHIVYQVLNSLPTSPAQLNPILKSLGRIQEWHEDWLAPLRKFLATGAESQQMEVISSIADSRTSQLNKELARLGFDRASHAVRFAASTCLAETGAELPEQCFQLILSATKSKEAPLARISATRALSNASLSKPQLKILIDEIPNIEAQELPTLVEKIEESLAHKPDLAEHFARVRGRVNAKLDQLKITNKDVQRRVQQRLATLSPGDAKHGESIFYSNRAACSACHTADKIDKGGNTGPHLSEIGSIRRRPDLLEAIMFPSSTIVNSFETYLVLLKNGRTEQGVIQRADSRWLVLRDDQRKVITIPRDEIEELKRTKNSIMPEGLESSLNSDELSDLLAFLESLKRDKLP